MGKDGSGCLPRIGKRAPTFTASFVEDRQVVESLRHGGVVRTERVLADDQRSLVEPLRLPVLTLASIHEGQVVEGLAHVGVVRTERFLADGQRALVGAPPPPRTCPGLDTQALGR